MTMLYVSFAQVDGLPVYGVAIPTTSGLGTLMQMLGSKTRPILWHNMREEPVRTTCLKSKLAVCHQVVPGLGSVKKTQVLHFALCDFVRKSIRLAG